LAPDLVAGDWVIGSGVSTDQGRFPTDHLWARTLLEALPGAVHAEIVGVDTPIANPLEKRRLHVRTGAVAIDTESQIAARIAAAHRIPFAACRAVIDPAQHKSFRRPRWSDCATTAQRMSSPYSSRSCGSQGSFQRSCVRRLMCAPPRRLCAAADGLPGRGIRLPLLQRARSPSRSERLSRVASGDEWRNNPCRVIRVRSVLLENENLRKLLLMPQIDGGLERCLCHQMKANETFGFVDVRAPALPGCKGRPRHIGRGRAARSQPDQATTSKPQPGAESSRAKPWRWSRGSRQR